MRILAISSGDQAGGAERIALDLHRGLLGLGHQSQLLVGRQLGAQTSMEGLANGRSFRGRATLRLLKEAEYWTGLQGLFSPLLRLWMARRSGRWDVIHCHNLHGGYFALPDLQLLSRRGRLVMTLHDFWLCTGHCAYPLDCPRWRSGCGRCPALDRYPPLRTDRTMANASFRAGLIRRLQPVLVAPSRWAAEQVSAALGCPCRVIHNGVDTVRFGPLDRASARRQAHLPPDGRLLLYVANGGLASTQFKDPRTLLSAFRIVRARWGEPVRLVVVGGRGGVPADLRDEVIEPGEVRAGLAVYYAAADVLTHPTRDETFGLVLAEAMACGLPVVATRVGACQEVVADGVCGHLVRPGDPTAMAEGILRVLADREGRMARAARLRAVRHFSLERMVQRYCELYHQIAFGRPGGQGRLALPLQPLAPVRAG